MANLAFFIISAFFLIAPQPILNDSYPQTALCSDEELSIAHCLSLHLLNLSGGLFHTRLIMPPTTPPRSPVYLVPQVIQRYPHDTNAFTQGLVLFDGEFYESTGLYGRSSLRRVTIDTGAVQQQINIPSQYFAEGLALVDDRLIQLTWRESTAFVYDRLTFEQIGTLTYEGEGWGLCYDGDSLYMSNGTSTIDERDAQTFEIIRSFEVTRDGIPQRNLNELACMDTTIYANIWLTDEIVQFNKSDGKITAIIDASGLLTPEESYQADVLNGIVYDEGQNLYYITGKNWPYVFLVDFVPKENGE